MKGSRRYRGERRGIGILIPLLVVLCVVAAVSLYVINNNMVFTKEGSFFIPEKREETEEITANIIIESEEEPQQENNPIEKTHATDEIKAYFVPLSGVKDAAIFDEAILSAKAETGVNKLVLEVKAEDGSLAFETKTKIGKSTGLYGDSAVLLKAVEKAKKEGFEVAFYMSCFKDNEAARKNQEFSVRTSNKVIWLDGANMRWLSPYSDAAREYLTTVITELCEFLPDEIILSNISFPAFGKTEIISYDDSVTSREDMLLKFISDAKEAAGEVPLCAVYENYNEKYIKSSGQSAEMFAKEFDSVYIDSAQNQLTAPYESVKDKFKKAIPIKTEKTSGNYLIRK